MLFSVLPTPGLVEERIQANELIGALMLERDPENTLCLSKLFCQLPSIDWAVSRYHTPTHQLVHICPLFQLPTNPQLFSSSKTFCGRTWPFRILELWTVGLLWPTMCIKASNLCDQTGRLSKSPNRSLQQRTRTRLAQFYSESWSVSQSVCESGLIVWWS